MRDRIFACVLFPRNHYMSHHRIVHELATPQIIETLNGVRLLETDRPFRAELFGGSFQIVSYSEEILTVDVHLDRESCELIVAATTVPRDAWADIPEGRRPSLALPQEAASDWLEFLSDTEDRRGRRECGCWREEYCE